MRRVSSYLFLRVLVALATITALGVICLVLVVNGPNRWILSSMAAGAITGCVFGATAIQVLEPGPPLRTRPGEKDAAPGPWEQFLRELDRSRRYDLSFTLARIGSDRRIGHSRGRRGGRRPRSGLHAVLQRNLRSTDVAWSEGAFVYLLLPGVDREEWERLRGRIAARHPDLMPGEWTRCACFPEDGLTSNALLTALNEPSAEAARLGTS